jgi:glycosyltransferase involved in cell wall biosynthesis
MNLYCTSDTINSPTGGGLVTFWEIESLKELGEPVYVVNPAPCANPFDTDSVALEAVSNLLKTTKVNIAHFYAGTYSKTISALKAAGVKVVYTCAAHDVKISMEEFEKLGMRFELPHLTDPELFNQYLDGYRKADLVICPSVRSKNICAEQGCKNIKVIPHGCTLPNEVKPIPKKFNVNYLGAPGADKGLIYLIKAWAKLNYKESRLMIAGNHTIEFLVPMVRQYGRGNIEFKGFVKSTTDFYNSCSTYIQSSGNEGFGLEVIEAMAHGRPVVCSDGAGAADCITSGVDGTIVPSRNSDAIAVAIEQYRKNPDMVIEHGKAAREKAKNYTWDKVKKMYCDAWRELTI